MSDDLLDMAALAGGQVMTSMIGWPPEQMKIAYFGRARRVTLTRKNLTIMDGAGDQTAVKQRIAQIRAQMSHISRTSGDWDGMKVRVGRLAGGIGVLKIDAFTEHELELKRELAKKVMQVLNQARVEGAGRRGVSWLRRWRKSGTRRV